MKQVDEASQNHRATIMAGPDPSQDADGTPTPVEKGLATLSQLQ